METISTLLNGLLSGIGPFFLLLGLLIFVHELGHYLVAVYFGVRVETFSLGFGKKIWSYKRGDTTYCISIIPLGGYVKMYGDDPSVQIPEDQKPYAFLHKPVWPRIAIVLAGPIMNLLFAIVIFAAIGMLGETVPGSQLGDIKENTVAYSSGFRSGDLIKEINGQAVHQWSEVKEAIESNPNSTLQVKVKRDTTGEDLTLNAKTELVPNSFLFSSQREVGQVEGLSAESSSTLIGVPDPNSLGARSGLKTFDLIESINGEETAYRRQLEPAFAKALSTGSDIKIKVSQIQTGSSANEADPTAKDEQYREITIPASDLRLGESVLAQLGITSTDLFILDVRPKTPAAIAGLKPTDYLIKIDGQPISEWHSVLDRVKSYKASEGKIEFTILRNGVTETLNIAPELVDLPTAQGAMEKRFAIGVVPAIYSVPNNEYLLKTSNPLTAAWYGLEQSWVWTKLIAISVVRLVQNEVSARNIGGIITIGRVASKSFDVGLVAFLKMMAIISINLFLMNLLPVPVLDGGHLVFFTIEALKGAPISFKKLEIAQQVGMVILLSLMLFAFFNDITHLISSW